MLANPQPGQLDSPASSGQSARRRPPRIRPPARPRRRSGLPALAAGPPGHPRTADHAAGHTAGSATDITARKQAETVEQGRAAVLEMIAANEPLADILHTLVAMVEEEYPHSHASIVLLAAAVGGVVLGSEVRRQEALEQ